MTSYYRVMLGQKSSYADECIAGGFIGAHYDIDEDLTNHLPDEWRVFNKAFIPKYLGIRPEKTRVGAGLACGALWTVAKGISIGDVVLSPNGNGHYYVGEVTGGYEYHPDKVLPHRRSVKWSQHQINRSVVTPELRRSLGSIGTVCNITQYANEIDSIIGQNPERLPQDIEDPFSFALEAHLEDFLVKNWSNTEFGKDYDIFELDGVLGKQLPTDTGPLDILAISKDKKRLLVVELKKGRASDAVVGQTLRYMGFVQEELADPEQTVLGAIVAYEDDQRIRRALKMTPSITFYRYQLSFRLVQN